MAKSQLLISQKILSVVVWYGPNVSLSDAWKTAGMYSEGFYYRPTGMRSQINKKLKILK